ncbi:MAG: hypothetical protein NZ772_03760 [Cyanobacteria bacterium]|nr:hypothetical protein [Cyanobacteriota bacterium]MDW8200571.1 hypothetical protein [Cyanobacteriota bacterium SKYGB_h_bin112]
MNLHPLRVSSVVACSLGTIVLPGLGQKAMSASEPVATDSPLANASRMTIEQAELATAEVVTIAPPEPVALSPSFHDESAPLAIPPSPEISPAPTAADAMVTLASDQQLADSSSVTSSNDGQPSLPDAETALLAQSVSNKTSTQLAVVSQPQPTSTAPIELSVPLPAATPQYYALNSSSPLAQPEVILIDHSRNLIQLPPSISPPKYVLEDRTSEFNNRFKAMLALANLPDFSPRLPLNLRVVTDRTITSDHPITDSAETIAEWAERMRLCRNARAVLEHVQPDGETTIPVVFTDAPIRGPRVVRNANGNLVCVEA